MQYKCLYVLALASAASASPLEARQQCTGQSCKIADVSGSTGATTYNYPDYPTGDTQAGDCCIIRYRPEIADQIYAARPGLKSYCAANPNAGANALFAGYSSGAIAERSSAEELVERGLSIYDYTAESFNSAMVQAAEPEKRAACKSKILIFARGTFENAPIGSFVGPQIQQELNRIAPGVWDVRGVNYNPSVNGDYCLGLPGGVEATKLLESTAAQCPQSTLVLGGYSQGAMVVRNGIANSTAAVAGRVKGLFTFGDPFNGAKVKNLKAPITVYCAAGDGVCSGQFQISFAHISYSASGAPQKAARLMNALK